MSQSWRDTNRGDEPEAALRSSTEEELQACAYAAKPAHEPGVEAAAVLLRMLHVASASRRNAAPRQLAQLFTFVHEAWLADRHAPPQLSELCRDRLTTALTAAMSAAHKAMEVPEEWMLGLPLLRSLQDDHSQQLGLGLGRIGVAYRASSPPSRTSAGFEATVAKLRPLFGRDTWLATSCFRCAPLEQASQLASDLPSAAVALEQWAQQLQRVPAAHRREGVRATARPAYPSPSPHFVPGSPYVMLFEPRQARITYQDDHILAARSRRPSCCSGSRPRWRMVRPGAGPGRGRRRGSARG